MDVVSLRDRDVFYNPIEVRRTIPGIDIELVASGGDVAIDVNDIVDMLVYGDWYW